MLHFRLKDGDLVVVPGIICLSFQILLKKPQKQNNIFDGFLEWKICGSGNCCHFSKNCLRVFSWGIWFTLLHYPQIYPNIYFHFVFVPEDLQAYLQFARIQNCFLFCIFFILHLVFSCLEAKLMHFSEKTVLVSYSVFYATALLLIRLLLLSSFRFSGLVLRKEDTQKRVGPGFPFWPTFLPVQRFFCKVCVWVSILICWWNVCVPKVGVEKESKRWYMIRKKRENVCSRTSTRALSLLSI